MTRECTAFARTLSWILGDEVDEDLWARSEERLDRPALTAEERAALLVEGQDSRLDAFLAARFGGALRAALSAVAPGSRIRVEVLRAEPQNEAEQALERRLRREVDDYDPLGTPSGFAAPLPGGAAPRWLVLLADRETLAELERGEFGRAQRAGIALRRAGANRADGEPDFAWDLGPVCVISLEDLAERVCRAFEADDRATEDGPSAALARKEDRDRSGSLIDGRYLLIRQLGVGGFGEVYEARDASLGNRVAIKLLRGNDELGSRQLKEEARRLTQLSHPHIVDWKNFGELEDGSSYLVMELLDGEELAALSEREGPLDPRRAAAILLQILDALRAAHSMGERDALLHLDLKPRNVLLVEAPGESTRDWAKLIDFGIGQHVRGDRRETPLSTRRVSTLPNTLRNTLPATHARPRVDPDPRATVGPTLASSGTVSGADVKCTGCTPQYASPEHCAHLLPERVSVRLDARSDLYSLGVIGYELLTGTLPFDESDPLELAEIKQVRPAPKLEGRAGVPRRLARFLDRCMELRREDRWPDAREAFAELQRIVHRPRTRLGTLIGSLLVTAIAVAATLREGPPVLPFDVSVETEAGELVPLDHPLFLGPDRPAVRLRVEGVTEPVDDLRFVETAGGAPMRGSTLTRRPDGDLQLGMAGGSGRASWTGYLELSRAGGAARTSRPISLVWLGRDAVQIEGAGVPGLDGRELDPVGARIEVVLRGRPEDVDAVFVESPTARLRAQQDLEHAGPGTVVYTVGAEDLGLRAGRRSLDVTVVDEARGLRRTGLDVDVTETALRIVEADVGGLRWDRAHLLRPGVEPVLNLRLTHPAHVAWQILDARGDVLADGSGEVGNVGEVPLTGLGPWPAEALQASLRITVRDDHRVLREEPQDRGRDDAALQLIGLPGPSEVEVGIDLGTGSAVPLDDEHPLFTASRELVLGILRVSPVPTGVRVVATADVGDWRSEHVEILPGPLTSSTSLTVAVPRAGRYALEVTTWRCDWADAPLDPDAGGLRAELLVDETSPVLTVVGPTEPVLRDPRPTLGVSIVLSDAGPASERSPYFVRWHVRASSGGEHLVAGEVGPLPLGGGDLVLPVLENLHREVEDGTYVLALVALDAAGNASAEARTEIVLDRHAPRLDLLHPLPDLDWAPEEGGARGLRVLALDGNGIQDVVCRISRSDAGGGELAVKLERDAADARLWTGGVRVPESWSGARVQLSVRARDRFGNATTDRFERPLGIVHTLLPPRVTSTRGRSDTVLSLVQGNRGGPYVFGGRLDEVEREALRSAGLGEYNASPLPRSWRVEFSTAAIGDFYLDVHEVTVAQVLQFLADEGGYGNDVHWPAGAAPDVDRKRALISALSNRGADLPATGLTWNEASAYARWAGKRLPTVVEMEFATRGAEYRPWSGWTPGSAAPRLESVNHRAAPGSAGEPWEVLGVGRDRTPDTGVWNLAGNVAEWTSTPASFLAFGEWPPDPGLHARRHASSLLDPAAAEELPLADMWVVGGSYVTERFDFSVLESRPRDTRSEDVGFRCAISADEVARALESPAGEFLILDTEKPR